MKTNYLIIGIIILAVVIGGVFYFNSSPITSNKNVINNSILKTEEWSIAMNYKQSLPGISNIVALPRECFNNQIYGARNINETYISSSADYILDIQINNITVDEQNKKRYFYSNILSWIYGKPDFVPTILNISTNYDSGIEDDTPFQKFKENNAYRIYLDDSNGKISFICHIEGIKELHRIDYLP